MLQLLPLSKNALTKCYKPPGSYCNLLKVSLGNCFSPNFNGRMDGHDRLRTTKRTEKITHEKNRCKREAIRKSAR